MKILQVNCVYNKGSTGKIVRDIHNALTEQGIESVVCYGRGPKCNQKNVYKTCSEPYAKINNLFSRFTGIMYGGCTFSTNRLIRIIKKENPDIVHLHCINGYFVNIYKLISWLKNKNFKTVLTLHAEFMYTGGCSHSINCNQWNSQAGCGNTGCPRWRSETRSLFFDRTKAMWKKMKTAFDGFDDIQIVGVSKWISDRAAISSILKGHKITTIHNGIDLQNFSFNKAEIDNYILKKYGLPDDKKIVIHVTPSFSNPLKGGQFFKQLADNLDEIYQPVVIGCKEKISDKIISIPFVLNQSELAALYRQSSVMVITSVSDNYPTVCIEANCCGTPVVGFDVGGVEETIGKDLGAVVTPFNVQELTKEVEKWCDNKNTLSSSAIESRRAYCDFHRMTNDYIELYESLLK